MKRTIATALIAIASFSITTSVSAYDQALAESYAAFFADVDGAGAGKAMHFITPEAYIDGVKAGKGYIALDVRTEKESALFGLRTENGLTIPAGTLFQKENLEKLPTEKLIVVICKSGARASGVGTALRHLGYDNVYILKGGFQGLSQYYGPKQAYE